MKIPASDAIQFVRGNGYPLRHKKVLPNDPCPCMSGKKAKHCCGIDTRFLYSRLTEVQLLERAADKRIAAEAEKKAAEPVEK